MNIIKTKLTRHSYVRIKPTKRFRLTDYRFCQRRNNMLFMSIFNNPSVKFTVVTVPLEEGTYKFKVQSLDDLNNINTGVETSVVLADRPWYPTNFVISDVTGNDVTFTWSAPTGGLSVDNYKIYGNGGLGGKIDRGTVLGTVSGSTFTTSVNVADGNWLFVIEAIAGSKESINYWAQAVTVPIADTVPDGPGIYVDPTPPYEQGGEEERPVNVELYNVSVGKCRIAFHWTYGDTAKYFNIYHDSGTGTMNWVTPAFVFNRQIGTFQNFVTTQITTSKDNVTYKFGIRAESASAVEDTNLQEYEVELDGVEPDNATNMGASSV